MGDLLYFPVYYFFRIIALLPLPLLYCFSDLIYFLTFYVLRYRKHIVYANLRNSFPVKTPAEIDKIARGFYRHLCDLLIEMVYQTGMGKKEIRRRVILIIPAKQAIMKLQMHMLISWKIRSGTNLNTGSGHIAGGRSNAES